MKLTEFNVIDKKRQNGVPERYIKVKFNDLTDGNDIHLDIIEQLKKYEFDRDIVLLGDVGTGKTTVASALIDKAIRNEWTAYYTNYYDIYEIYIEHKDLYKKIKNCRFLVIDEFGRGDTKDNSAKLDKMFELINYRYNEMKPTMILSNLNAKQLTEKIGNGLYSRLKHNSISFNFNWDDYRLK